MDRFLNFFFQEQKTRIAPILISIFVLVLITLHIFLYAYFPLADYDMAKVIWKFNESSNILEYIASLKWVQGIGILTYTFLSFGLGIIGLKMIDYIVLISTVFFILNFFLDNKIITALFLTLITGFIFHSSVVAYLGSYGMIIYMVNLGVGCFQLWLIKENKLLSLKLLSIEGFLIVATMSAFTFIDIRASFYFCMVYLVLLLSHLKDARFKNLLIQGFIVGIVLLVPLYSQMLFNEKIHKFQPQHVQSMLFSGGSVLIFIKSSMLELIETLLGQNKLYQIFFFSLFFTGIGVSLKKNEDKELLWILMACLIVQIIASLFRIYPFGSIRYCLPLVPIIIYMTLKGGNKLLNLNFKFSKLFIISICLVLLILMGNSAINHVIPHIKTAKIDNEITQKFRTDKETKLFTDIVTETLVRSNNTYSSGVISTWNIVKHIQEEKDFYNDFSQMIKNEKKIHLLLFFPIQDKGYDTLLSILMENNYKMTEHEHSRSQQWYVYEKYN